MSGHSKWSTIKRKKAAVDAKRGKLFTRLLREIQIAAKIGGGSTDANVRLKTAVQTAKSASVPADSIDRAIKRGTGEDEGTDYEEVVYEGYGPAGVAILIKVLTDNKNRSVASVRHALTKHNGSLAQANAVAYQFTDRGMITIPKGSVEEEALYDSALEAGAEDIKDEGEYWEVQTQPQEFEAVREVLHELCPQLEGELRSVPNNTVMVSGKDAETLLKLLDMLDELDDVQSVEANFDIDESELKALSGEGA